MVKEYGCTLESLNNKNDLSNNLKLHSISSAAKIMGISRDTIKSIISRGELGYIQIGKRKKIPTKEIQRYQKEMTVRKVEPQKKKLSSEDIFNIIKQPYRNNKSIDSKKILNNILKE